MDAVVTAAPVPAPEQLPAAEETSEAPAARGETGAASFSDLVRAHFRREKERGPSHRAASEATERTYRTMREQFEREEGRIAAVYWSTRNASAVALTIGEPRRMRNPITDTEMEIRIHRVTDWMTRDAPAIADLLHECDLLAIRAGEILRGTSERIAMRWLFSEQEHVLGYLEREPEQTPENERAFVEGQRRELARIEEYYLRAAAKAGRIVYVSGMLAGAFAIVTAVAVTALILAGHPKRWDNGSEVLLISIGAGAVGALVSVLSRMSGGADKFNVDFEVGRALLRRLGLYKPLVGTVFGVAVYFILKSGLLMTRPDAARTLYFYGALAFLAGFSERFTGVIFGDVERLVSAGGGSGGNEAPPATTAGKAPPADPYNERST